MRLLKDPNFQFMDKRRIAFAVSGVLLLISLVSLVVQGGPKFGIDFRGGTLIEYQFEKNGDATAGVPIQEVRSAFAAMGFDNAEIKYFGSEKDIFVKVDRVISKQEEFDDLKSRLNESFADYEILQRRNETVGPKIGKELVWDAIGAILFSMAFILVYIMFRFELRFGIGAVVALFHDITITLGVFSLMQKEISIPVIAAILTIIGYSLNDTIVVFDRIRENLKTFKRKLGNYVSLVNSSINETLSRTVVTSLTTLFVVLILYVFGGEIIKDFAFALIIGVIVGTYSSVFVASPVLIEWEARQAEKKAVASKK